jgi:uncharacterized protein (DUF58 family)
MHLAWLIINMVALLGFLAWMYRRYALKHVSYSRHFSRSAVFEGESVEMVECIANRKLLPLPWLRLESLLAQELVFGKQANLDIRRGEHFQNHISLFSLRSYRQIIRRHQVTCVKRGTYRLDSATMTAGDPLGLAAAIKRFPLSLELLVYPRIVSLQELPLPNHSWLGEIVVRRWIVHDPFLTAGTREYRSGDPLQLVNWKATARTGALQVHNKDFTAGHRLMVCLNLEISETMWNKVTEPERIEQGICYAASVADYALRHGVETGFMCNGWINGGPKRRIRIEPAGGTTQMTDILETLARLELEAVDSMVSLLEQEIEAETTGMDFLVITCHTSDKLRAAAGQLAVNGNGVEWMRIPDGGGRFL